MPMGNLTIPRLAGGATASYQDELDDIAISQERFDDVNFVAKKLTAMVPVSNDLIRRSPIGVEEVVRDDLVQTIARREDLAFIRGDGTDKGPIGMRRLALPANLITGHRHARRAGARRSADRDPRRRVGGDPRPAKRHVAHDPPDLDHGADHRPLHRAPRAIRSAASTSKTRSRRGMFEGYPIRLTQQIPTNLVDGTNTKGSEVYFVDMADFVIADTYNVDRRCVRRRRLQ